MAGYTVHGYEPEAPEGASCDRCERPLAGKLAYLVSHDGKQWKYRLCPGCNAHAKAAYGSTAREDLG